jgi:hypothetical protein
LLSSFFFDAHSGPIDFTMVSAKYVTGSPTLHLRLRRGRARGKRYAISAISAIRFDMSRYRGTLVHMTEAKGHLEVERIQTGVRIEKRLLKVLKAVAELKDMSLGDLLEGIVLHAFEGKSAFSPQTLKEIEQF